jgi:hypothetical protein
MPKLQRLKLIPEEHTLLATSTNSEGMGIIDRIDTLNNIIIDTYSFEQTYCQPYAIGVSLAESNKAMVVEREMILSDSEDKLIKKNSIDILARRVLSTYQEKVNFPQEGARLPAKNKGAFIFQNIYFEQCQMINTTKKRRVVIDRKDLSILQYEFYIPYYIELKDEGNKEYIVEGRLEGAQRASLFIPCYAEKRGVQFVASSFTNLSYLPYIIDNRLKFSASALIFTKAIIEEIVSIPNSKDILDDQVRIQRDEGE